MNDIRLFAFAFFFLINLSYTNSQNQNNIWCFGDSAGIDFNNLSSPATFSTSLDTRGSCVSIADTNGQLLFYANTRATLPGNTTLVWNKNHQLMQNGDSIIGSGWYNELIIIPIPGDRNKYYLFSAGVTSVFGFYYSIVDMSVNGGLGTVTQKNIQLNNLKAWDAMAAVRHANGRDWWLISKDYTNGASTGGNNWFHVNLITPYGITDSIQRIGGIENGNLGNMCFSLDGSRFLFNSYNGLLEIMNFDRCTGIFSNAIIINPGQSFPRYSGSAFSPNGNILYLSSSDTVSYLYQFNLLASNIPNSRQTITSISYPKVAGGALRLAPDDKIYWTCAWTNQIVFNYPYQDSMYHTENMNLSVINNPDSLGSSCNFSLYSFNLGGKRTYWGLPNNPDYNLGAIPGSICDSLNTGIQTIIKPRTKLYVYYNPEWQKVFINANQLDGNKVRLELYDALGRLQIEDFGMANSGYYTKELMLNDFSPGIYIIRLSTEKEKISQKFMLSK